MAKKTKIFLWLGLIVLVIAVIMLFIGRNSSPTNIGDGKGVLSCRGNDVYVVYESGRTDIVNHCATGSSCKIGSQLDAMCVNENTYETPTTPNNGGTGITTPSCAQGQYLGENDICFDYPGKNLPKIDYNTCINNALKNYYSAFYDKSYTVSWVTAKVVEKDIYDSTDIWWKYIGCASVLDNNGAFVSWGITSDCTTGKSGDMLTAIQTSDHNVCGSNRLKG